MNVWMIWENALFLRFWRERMRAAPVIASLVVTALLLLVFFFSFFLGNAADEPARWAARMWVVVAVCQGVVLFIIAPFSTVKMTLREQALGTLDFHRISPSPYLEKVIGMLIGAPVLEGCIVLATLPVCAVLAVHCGASSGLFLSFYGSLLLSALFLNSFVLSMGLHRKSGRRGVVGEGGAVGLVLFIWLLSTAREAVPVLYHLSSLPAYQILVEAVLTPGAAASGHNAIRFFTVPMPSLIMQSLVQIPLILFAWIASVRGLARPERPVFSKVQALLLLAFIQALFLGTVVTLPPEFFHAEASGSSGGGTVFLGMLLLTGYGGLLLVTPDRLLYLRGVRRAVKIGWKRVPLWHDQATGHGWLAAFLLLWLLLWWVQSSWTGIPLSGSFPVRLLLAMAFLGWFAGGLEAFNLSSLHTKRAYLWVAILLLWVFVPLLGTITWPHLASDHLVIYGYVTSPAIVLLPEGLFSADAPFTGAGIRTALFLNLLFCIPAFVSAARARKRLRRSSRG